MFQLQDVPDLVGAGFRRLISGAGDGRPDWVADLEAGADAGYFGPGSATWAVHGALPTLLGGVRALLLQTLHPAVLAGVEEHSRYAEDLAGRLAGTTRWVTVVTFGDVAAADRESARVRGMHRRVTGTYETPSGRAPYSASDPELLRWVHVTFTDSFLAAHRIWGGPIPGGADAYVGEWARAGELVGVVDPPRTEAELADELAGFVPQLRVDELTRRTVAYLTSPPLPLAARPAYRLLFAGAVATLPPEHRRMLGFPPVPLAVARPPVAALFAGLRVILGPRPPAETAARDRLARLAAD